MQTIYSRSANGPTQACGKHSLKCTLQRKWGLLEERTLRRAVESDARDALLRPGDLRNVVELRELLHLLVEVLDLKVGRLIDG